MTLLEFLKRAHRWTGGASIPDLRDPLEALASLVRTTPASPRARVVLRVLIALRDKAGEFEESDLWALDAEAQLLLTALVSDQLGRALCRSRLRGGCGSARVVETRKQLRTVRGAFPHLLPPSRRD